MAQIDDMEAIDAYFARTVAVTPKAIELKRLWIDWYNDLGWWSKHYDSDTYAEARQRRNDFNLANAVTEVQRAQVEQVIQSGLTTEEMEAELRRTLPPVDYYGSIWKSIRPYVIGIGIVGVLGGALYLWLNYNPAAIASRQLMKPNRTRYRSHVRNRRRR